MSATGRQPAERLEALAERLDAALPQTQCQRCGYGGCRPYAEAVAAGEAIDRCAPGGAATLHALAGIVGAEPNPLTPLEAPPRVAFIDEERCIGCARCLEACPVDAIVGAAQLMHTVIAEECTGCALCLEPCPVDCIELVPDPAPETHPSWGRPGGETDRRTARARARYRERSARRRREAAEQRRRQAEKGSASGRRAVVAEALARARARKAGTRR